MSEEKKTRFILMVIIGTVAAIIGFIVIPPLLRKYSNRLYKQSLKRRVPGFEDMDDEFNDYETEDLDDEFDIFVNEDLEEEDGV